MYNINEKVIIFLSCFEFLTYEKIQKLIDFLETPEKLIHKWIEQKHQILRIITQEQYDKISENLDDDFLYDYLKRLDNNKIKCITLYSDNYPEKLRHLDNPPFILYCKGDLSLLNTASIGIVGTRNPSHYGEIITKDFAEGLAKSGITIISGLAYGVDKIANEIALKNGKTIAVLGGGFNHIYPATNTELANQIAEKGLLISEYHIDITPKQYYFPARNRIIAGLADGILITEAKENSGSMYTKDFALDLGKEVYAIPGNINSENSLGTNKLIRTAQSCCVLSYKDILENFNKKNIIKKVIKIEEKSNKVSSNEDLILKVLKKGELHLEELLVLTNLDIKTLNTCLTTLAIRGIIKKLSGNFYSL